MSVQASDRRLTPQRGPEDEEQNNTGTLDTTDGRFAFAFTGLARAGAFNTRDWLISALPKCGAPTYESYHVFEGLKARATTDSQTQYLLRDTLAYTLGVHRRTIDKWLSRWRHVTPGAMQRAQDQVPLLLTLE